jgi:hypothetical protein
LNPEAAIRSENKSKTGELKEMIAEDIHEIKGNEINVLRQRHNLPDPSPQWSNPFHLPLTALFTATMSLLFISFKRSSWDLY